MIGVFGARLDARDSLKVDLSRGLDSRRILAADGRPLATLHGLLIEHFLPPGVMLAGTDIRLDFVPATAEAFEQRVLDGLAGLFLVVTEAGAGWGRRLYPDAAAGVPVVYCPETRRIGASAATILNPAEYCRRFLADRHARLVAAEGKGWIPGTLTAHQGLRRLLPNHYLDLDNFSVHRFWPHAAPAVQSLETAADSIAADLAGHVEAVARQFDTAVTLTAGWDSRLVAAASRRLAHRITYVTIGAAGAGLDQIAASRMGAALGLRHRLVPVAAASEAAQQRWDWLVGHAVREDNRLTHPTLAGIDAEVMLTGICGEPGRCRLYRHDIDTINDAPATADFVRARLGVPDDADVRADIDAWLAELPPMPRAMVLDLAYWELKCGSWAMAQGAAQKTVKLSLMPFAQRRVQQAFMAVAPAEKRTDRLFRAIGERLWPELTAFPVNRHGDLRDWLGPLPRLFDPQRLRRHLRARIA